VNSEEKLNWVAGRIKRDAGLKGIDLSEPAHAFTVWAYYPWLDRSVYSGSYETHNDAAELAADHARVQKGDLYIAMGPLSNLSVMKFEQG
jgi:hypothetical protein